MLGDITDTIVAVASASGVGARAIVRLTGPDAIHIACSSFRTSAEIDEKRRRSYAGDVVLGAAGWLPAELYLWPAPHTYTGQPLSELHLLASPPLVERLVATLLTAGARSAQPGEFTLRAFLAGKRDLPRAEAVHAVVSANSREELTSALAQMAGGVTQPLSGLRDDLLNLLADVEAGLDFVDEDIRFVDRDDVLHRLAKGMAQLTTLRRQLDQRALAGRIFRAVLTGATNAGKSSLFNALAGGSALVSEVAGTTRDYLIRRLELDGVAVELVDTAGWQEAQEPIAEQAQRLARRETESADLILWCIEAIRAPSAAELVRLGRSDVIGVATKCDLAPPPPGLVATSARFGTGLEELRSLLQERVRAAAQPALAPSLSRCRHHVDSCLEQLRKAHHAVLFDEPAEIFALDLRGALNELGALVGAVFTDDLLDRIFSRFCIGK